jgi:Domain of unknown function (DUF4157)
MSLRAQALVQAQQKTAVTSSNKGNILQRAAVVPEITPVHSGILQRCSGGVECEGCRQKRLEREGMLQRAAVNAAPVNENGSGVPPIVHEVLRSPGQALDAGTRAFMEPRFGFDFSGVRVHTDGRAAVSARAVNAVAYTVGRDVVFGEGMYAPGTSEGKRLLAHELTHVVQQETFSDLGGYTLKVGSTNDQFESQAGDVAQNIPYAYVVQPIAAISKPFVQRDLARPPKGAPSPLVPLTSQQVQDAIAFNQERFSDPYSIRVIRDVLGVRPLPAIVDEELIEAIVQWQSERHMTQDGKIGHITTRSIYLELVAEGQLRDALLLLMDSYRLPGSLRLNDIRVGIGLNCCFTTVVPAADAVTSGGPLCGGGPINMCICRTSVPHNIAEYDHFVRILGHELIHVPQCASGTGDIHVEEFEAFFWEVCSQGRAPQLSAGDRLGHAGMAIAHFNNIPFPFRTPALLDKRDKLNHLIAAGGVGPC